MTGAMRVLKSLQKNARKNGGDIKDLLVKRHSDKIKIEDDFGKTYEFLDGSKLVVSPTGEINTK